MLEKSTQFLSSDQPNEQKSLDVALNIAGVEKYARIRVLTEWKGACRRHLLAAMQLAVSCCELYFARCCAVNWTGTFASESKVMCLSDFKK